jgi:dynein heavy chain
MVFRKYLSESLSKNFGEPDEKNNPVEEPIIFTSFISEHQGQDPLYLESSVEVLKKVLDDKMEEYNEIKARMNLVLFK